MACGRTQPLTATEAASGLRARILISVLAVVLLTGPARAEIYHLVGAGNVSCSSWTSDQRIAAHVASGPNAIAVAVIYGRIVSI